MIEQYIFSWISGIFILFSGWLLTQFIVGKLQQQLIEAEVSEEHIKLASRYSNLGLLLCVTLVALNVAGAKMIYLIAAGILLAFLFHNTLINLISGIILTASKPYKIGDMIEVNGLKGCVTTIKPSTTILRSETNSEIILPNKYILDHAITNYSTNEIVPLDLTINVSKNFDTKEVKTTLEKVLAEESNILKEPKPTIGVLNFSDQCVNFTVRPWIKNQIDHEIHLELQEKIKRRFEEELSPIPSLVNKNNQDCPTKKAACIFNEIPLDRYQFLHESHRAPNPKNKDIAWLS